MKIRDVIEDIKAWWDMIPGWHERILWCAGGAVVGAIVARLL